MRSKWISRCRLNAMNYEARYVLCLLFRELRFATIPASSGFALSSVWSFPFSHRLNRAGRKFVLCHKQITILNYNFNVCVHVQCRRTQRLIRSSIKLSSGKSENDFVNRSRGSRAIRPDKVRWSASGSCRMYYRAQWLSDAKPNHLPVVSCR